MADTMPQRHRELPLGGAAIRNRMDRRVLDERVALRLAMTALRDDSPIH